MQCSVWCSMNEMDVQDWERRRKGETAAIFWALGCWSFFVPRQQFRNRPSLERDPCSQWPAQHHKEIG